MLNVALTLLLLSAASASAATRYVWQDSHIPTLSSQFSPLVINWLLAHPKP